MYDNRGTKSLGNNLGNPQAVMLDNQIEIAGLAAKQKVTRGASHEVNPGLTADRFKQPRKTGDAGQNIAKFFSRRECHIPTVARPRTF